MRICRFGYVYISADMGVAINMHISTGWFKGTSRGNPGFTSQTLVPGICREFSVKTNFDTFWMDGPGLKHSSKLVPSGKPLHYYGKSTFFLVNPLSMVIFNSYVKLPEGTVKYNIKSSLKLCRGVEILCATLW